MKRSHATILVVDDDPTDLLFIRSAFQKVGTLSTIQTVLGGREAIKYLQGDSPYADRSLFAYPDFIITDLKMPDVDGFELLQHCRLNPNSAIIPIVVFSGSQDDDDIRKAYILGASSFHQKPSSPAELRELVKALHDYWMVCDLPLHPRRQTEMPTQNLYKLGAEITESTAPWFRSPASLSETMTREERLPC